MSELDEIKARYDASASRPWSVNKREPWIEYHVPGTEAHRLQQWTPDDEYYPQGGGAQADAEEIVQAHNHDIPWLIGEIERLKTAITEALDAWNSEYPGVGTILERALEPNESEAQP